MSNEGLTSQTILVIGGGIAGISAAVEAAETGQDVILVEAGPTLGGRVAGLNRYFPKLCHPTCGLEINYQRIRKNPRLKVMTMSRVTAISGSRGAYTVSVTATPRHVNDNCTGCGACAEAAESEIPNPFNFGMNTIKAAYLPHEMAFPMRYVIDPSVVGTTEGEKIKAACKYEAVDLEQKEETFELTVGAIIHATGWKPYDAGQIDSYSYAECADIITNVEMERLAAHDGPTHGKILRPSDGKEVKKMALIQCAGSRDYNHLPYCSRICCLASMKHAAYLREQYADAQVDIYYIDLRAHDKLEAFYQRIKNDPQVNWIKSKPARIMAGEDGNPVVKGENTLTREIYAESYDMVVLATGMEPASMENVSTEVDEYGFVVPAHGKDDEGQFACGVASGPLDVSMSVQSATAAALKAIRALSS